LVNSEQITNLVYNVQPDEIYHLGAQSHVKVSFDTPEYTGDITGLGTMRLLESVRRSGIKSRLYNAASSEMFGNGPVPQSETTPLEPRSPYAAAKVYAYSMTRLYREGYHLFAVNGILFNHESPRRGETFVTRKITRGLAAIVGQRQKKLYLGNLEAKRDWGYAPEYVEAMWTMLQQETPDDYAIGTGEAHSVKTFLEEAFSYLQLDWRAYVEIDPRYFRPLEVAELIADTAKSRAKLGWNAQVSFPELVRIMVDADLERAGLEAPGEGQRILQNKFGDWHRWRHNMHDILTGRDAA
jgi:GDPmannose 4,6-dehydratase